MAALMIAGCGGGGHKKAEGVCYYLQEAQAGASMPTSCDQPGVISEKQFKAIQRQRTARERAAKAEQARAQARERVRARQDEAYRQMVGVLVRVCRGATAPQAVLRPTGRLAVFPSLKVPGLEFGELPHTGDYGRTQWEPRRFADVHLVACGRERFREIGPVCRYTPGLDTLQRGQLTIFVDIREAGSGRLIASKTFEGGSNPPACPETIKQGFGGWLYESPPGIEQWLKLWLHR